MSSARENTQQLAKICVCVAVCSVYYQFIIIYPLCRKSNASSFLNNKKQLEKRLEHKRQFGSVSTDLPQSKMSKFGILSIYMREHLSPLSQISSKSHMRDRR